MRIQNKRAFALGTIGALILFSVAVALIRFFGSARQRDITHPISASPVDALTRAVQEKGADPTTVAAPTHPVQEKGADPTTTLGRDRGIDLAAQSKLPREFGTILDESRSNIRRMSAVDSLHDTLSRDAVETLRRLLKNSTLSEGLRNNVANKLRRCGTPDLVSDLTAMLWKKTETPKWRNYCVQHLYLCYSHDQSPAALNALIAATKADENLVRTCAIWSIARVASPSDARKRPDDTVMVRARTTALNALRETSADPLVYEAGIQSCALLGLAEALPDIRKIASEQRSFSVHVRTVAVAAIGDLGDESDFPLLRKIAESKTGQLQSAAKLANQKIHTRHRTDRNRLDFDQ